MCLWEGKKPRWSFSIPERFAISGYKYLSVAYSGEHVGLYRSPYMGHPWMNKEMHALAPPTTKDEIGIFAYKKKKHAERANPHFNYIVKVKLWGRVLRFDRQYSKNGFLNTEGGFRAEHARIVEVYPLRQAHGRMKR